MSPTSCHVPVLTIHILCMCFVSYRGKTSEAKATTSAEHFATAGGSASDSHKLLWFMQHSDGDIMANTANQDAFDKLDLVYLY